jgi:hypothetical protein
MRHLPMAFIAAVAVVATVLAPTDAGGFVSHKDFDPQNFSGNSTTIDNQWIPLVPGTQFTLAGQVKGPDGTTPHRVVFTVTDLAKVINGVRTLVLWDRDYSAGQLVEEELAFHAQDNAGNVWNLGEYPEEHEDGTFIGAPNTWIAGVAEAQAGILMQADPQPGTPEYLQGYAPDIEFEDRAKVSKTGQRACVPVGCYENVLVIDEWNPREQPQDGHQLKYYAPSVGNVRVRAVGGEEQETLSLVKIRQLDAAAMAGVRRAALRLDRRAYKVARQKYQNTPPAEPL